MIVVTGATGQLGRLVIEELAQEGPRQPDRRRRAEPREGRRPRRAGRPGPPGGLHQPETLGPAFAGAEKILLISSSEVGQRVAAAPRGRRGGEEGRRAAARLHQHPARRHLAAWRSPRSTRPPRRLIRASGLPYVFLRNGWYTENYTENLAPALQHGAIVGSAGDGRIAAATRADYAAAAVAVLTGSGHENKVYELAGDGRSPWPSSPPRCRARPASRSPTTTCRPSSTRACSRAGLPGPYAEMLADSDVGASRGELNDSSGDLRRLIGRPTTPLADAVAVAFKR